MPYRTTNDGDFVPYGHFGYPDYPSGLLRASAHDMGRFIAAYSNGGELDGERVLEASTIDTMYEGVVPEVMASQGVFWYWSTIDGRDVIGHGGSDYGVSTDLLYDPGTGVGVVVMTNVEWGDGVTLPLISIEQLMFDAGEALAAE